MKTALKIIILTFTAAFVTAGDKVLLTRLEILPRNVEETAREIIPGTRGAITDPTQRPAISGRALWIKSRGYVSEDPVVFRLGAAQHLAALGLEITQLRNDSGIEPRAYFRTRILALDQQREYLGAELARLTPEQIQERMSGGRIAFDQSMEALDEAMDQAGREAGRLSRIALR